jgi:hypothetical protein
MLAVWKLSMQQEHYDALLAHYPRAQEALWSQRTGKGQLSPGAIAAGNEAGSVEGGGR